MTENGKPRDVGLKLWLILSTIITAIVSAVGVLFSLMVFSFGTIYGIVFLIWIVGNPYLSFLAWKHYRASNRQLVIILSIIHIIVSLINIGIYIIVFLAMALTAFNAF